jgi:parallel beta-helix repeat protein
MTVRNMPKAGISVRTSDNVLEGLKVHGNLLSGIHIHESYDVPVSNRNIIRDSVIWDNSGAGLMSAEYADGGNSDGISISSGQENRVENCLVYGNSDDGIDVWRTTDSYVGYSIVHSSGIASGNGQGVKAGGAAPSARAVIEHNLSYNNLSAGFDFNSGVGVIFRHNTSWENGRGFQLGEDTLSTKNLAFDTDTHNDSGDQDDNSWQRAGTPTPQSTDPSSPDFLVPAGTDFEDLGAHTNRE